jgi:uridine phosphorylase
MSANVLPITGLPRSGISSDVLVCGDPARATKIASFLEDAQLIGDQREYRSYRGQYEGMPVTICSHGVGASGAAIAYEELIVSGAQNILRVGTCGGLQPDVLDGHLAVAIAAVQNTGYVDEIVPVGYPAAADPYLTITLQQAAEGRGYRLHTGLVLTRDAFYGGVQAPRAPDYQTMSAANVLAVEMECAALFTVGLLRGVRTAAILAVDGNVLAGEESVDSYDPHRDLVANTVSASIKASLQALHDSRRSA